MRVFIVVLLFKYIGEGERKPEQVEEESHVLRRRERDFVCFDDENRIRFISPGFVDFTDKCA